MRKAAQVLSVLLHPAWMPTLAVLLAFAIDPHLTFTFSRQGQWIIIGMVFVMTALFPVSSVMMLWRSGLVSGPTMPRRGERVVPFLLTLFYFCMTYYLLRHLPNSSATLALFSGIILAMATVVLVTLRWKVSAHMAGIGGLLGMVLGLMVIHGVQAGFLPLLFIVAGALGTARLLASDHTPAQIYAGTAIGLLPVFICLVFRIYY